MRFLWTLLFLPLAACFDAEADLRFAEDETVTADVKMTLGRQLYDMMQLSQQGGETMCPPDSETTVGDESVICEFSETNTLDAAISEAEEAGNGDDFFKGMTVERLDSDRIRLSLPLDFDKAARPAELSADNPMLPAMLEALSGHAITFRVHAFEIIETNAVRSEDGKSTEIVIPATELLQPSGDFPDSFDVVFKYRNCGVLGLACN